MAAGDSDGGGGGAKPGMAASAEIAHFDNGFAHAVWQEDEEDLSSGEILAPPMVYVSSFRCKRNGVAHASLNDWFAGEKIQFS